VLDTETGEVLDQRVELADDQRRELSQFAWWDPRLRQHPPEELGVRHRPVTELMAVDDAGRPIPGLGVAPGTITATVTPLGV
jgi:hypothetical protein